MSTRFLGGRGGIPKRTHVELEDDVVWDWVTIGWELVMAWQLIKGTAATTCYSTPLVIFHVSPIHEKFLHFFGTGHVWFFKPKRTSLKKQGVDSRIVNCLDHVDQKGSQGWPNPPEPQPPKKNTYFLLYWLFNRDPSTGSLYHQPFQVPKMEVLYHIRLFWGWVFPYIALTYSLYRWIPPFWVPETFGSL